MRLFAAVMPPTAEVVALDDAIGDRDPELRWVPSHQWHVTLVFCGEVAETSVADLVERLRRAAARTAVFPLRLTGGGTFPTQPARARTLWAGLDGDVATLSRLAERCAAAARRSGITLEDRAFRPHLTLARARRGSVDVREHVARLSSYEGKPWRVATMRLVHSTLGNVVRHETVAELPLAETGDIT